jgi:hypothetical protein
MRAKPGALTADFHYLTERDCSEFMILPPLGSAFNDAELRALICAVLTDRYPPYKFQISLEWTHRGDAFVVIPVLGTAEADSFQIERPSSLGKRNWAQRGALTSTAPMRCMSEVSELPASI